ncbi:MAG: hypothetical protein HZA35_00840 [Parcubacteria group bacterium]|nr:hypothetical protein [Parcubacteria group bacterium]
MKNLIEVVGMRVFLALIGMIVGVVIGIGCEIPHVALGTMGWSALLGTLDGAFISIFVHE